MKLFKLSLAAAVIVSGLYAADEVSEIGVSANVAMTSNYVWRGMSQTDDSLAIQGGFDTEYKGLYAGVWASNISWTNDNESSIETDLYAGYANEIDAFSYDVGFIAYTYANVSDANNFGEAYLSLGYDFGVVSVGASYAMGVSISDFEDVPDNIEASISIPLPADISADIVAGSYDTVGTYYSASLGKTFGKFDLSLAYTGISYEDDAADDDSNFVATIATSF